MDWYSWLSKTNLEPTLIYEYGLAFVRNEVQEDDLAYFDHEFLQSIGISIAKHRLEILKLARKEAKERRRNGFSKLVLAMSKTRKLFTKWGSHRHSSRFSPTHRSQCIGDGKTVVPNRNMMWSGPLDMKMQEKYMVASRCHSVSGPLDGKMQERLTYPNWSPMVTRPTDGPVRGRSGFVCRSPTISGPIDRLGLSPKVNYYRSEKLGYDDDDGAKSLWSLMFQDMKPT